MARPIPPMDLPPIDCARILAKLLKEWRKAVPHYQRGTKDSPKVDRDWQQLEPKWSWLTHLRSSRINEKCDRTDFFAIMTYLRERLRSTNRDFDQANVGATFDAAAWLFDREPLTSDEALSHGLKFDDQRTVRDRRRSILDCLWTVLCGGLKSPDVSFVMSHDADGHRDLEMKRPTWERASGQQMRLMGAPSRVSMPPGVPTRQLVRNSGEVRALKDRQKQFQRQITSGDGERNIYSLEALKSYADRQSRFSFIASKYRRAHIAHLITLLDQKLYQVRLYELNPAHEVCLKLGVEPFRSKASNEKTNQAVGPHRGSVAVRGLASYQHRKSGPLGPEYMYSTDENLVFAYLVEFENAWERADYRKPGEVKGQLESLLRNTR